MSIAQGAMSASQGALDIVGKNITNANLPGYTRRTALMETQPLVRGAPGGVRFLGPERIIDQFAEKRIYGETGQLGAAEARELGLMGLEAVIAPTSSGGDIGSRLGEFFSSATELASHANDPTKRAQFLARAESLAESFRSASSGLTERRDMLFGKATDAAKYINDRTTEIASLNTKIAEATALGDGVPDLQDRRDLLLSEISAKAPISVVREPNGFVTVLSAGAALVSGKEVSKLDVSLDGSGNLKIEALRKSGAGFDLTSKMVGGDLGGIIEARDSDIPAMMADLDQLAFDFASAANAAHSAGFGLDGVTGRALFDVGATAAGAAQGLKVSSAVAGNPNALAAAGSAAELPGGNSGALALAGIGTQSLGGLGTAAARFGSLAGKLGTFQTSASSSRELREDTLHMATTLRDQVSGVSLEEEMVDLSRYQRAFEASMKVLRVADELLEGLIREV